MNDNETNKLLKEILKWHRFQGIEILKKKINEENLFTDAKDILVYYYSDGNKSSREIQEMIGVNFQKVIELWKKWINAGIAKPIAKQRGSGCKKLFELHELGLKLPKGKIEE